METRPHIVVVEDSPSQRQMLVEYLTRQGMRVTGVENGGGLRRLVEREMPAVVLLDVGLPDEDGFTLARFLREKSGRVWIVMVTAASVDRVVGLETGADDYVAKRYDPRELLARIKSGLRRATGAGAVHVKAAGRIRIGRCVLDLDKLVLVGADNNEESLTASEFDLLKVFAENPNRPLTREWLLEVTSHHDMDAFERSIDLRIKRLRRKVEKDPAHPESLRTVRGAGYMFVPPND